MKTCFFTALVFLAACCTAAADDQVQVVCQGKEVDPAQVESLPGKMAALLESCTVYLTSQKTTRETWDTLLHSASFVHVKFSPARQLEVMNAPNLAKERTAVQEILLPLPRGEYPAVYIRTPEGFSSYTKYYPEPFKQVVSESALGLSTVPPYDQIITNTGIK